MKHGMAPRNQARHWTYRRWQHMIQRCHNPNDNDYARYGGKGVRVCDRWRFGEGNISGYTLFMEDIGKYASRKLSLDRVDNKRGYEPGNVRWTTMKEQANNRRNTRVLVVSGVTRPLSEWCVIYNIGPKTVLYRLRIGMSDEAALLTPVAPRKPQTRSNQHHG